jgi:Tfp pilus assembly protein FimT
MIVTGNKGFTLVELVAFIVIGGIFLPASMIAFSEISLQCSASHTVTTDFSYYKRIEVTVQMPDNSIYDVYTVVSKRPKS